MCRYMFIWRNNIHLLWVPQSSFALWNWEFPSYRVGCRHYSSFFFQKVHFSESFQELFFKFYFIFTRKHLAIIFLLLILLHLLYVLFPFYSPIKKSWSFLCLDYFWNWRKFLLPNTTSFLLPIHLFFPLSLLSYATLHLPPSLLGCQSYFTLLLFTTGTPSTSSRAAK